MSVVPVIGIPTSVDKTAIVDTTKKVTDIMAAVITLRCTVILMNYTGQSSSKIMTTKPTITLGIMQVAESNGSWVSSNFIAKQMGPKKHYFHRKHAKLQLNWRFLVLRMQLIDVHLLHCLQLALQMRFLRFYRIHHHQSTLGTDRNSETLLLESHRKGTGR